MEEAVPRQDAVMTASEIQRAHVRDCEAGLREARSAQADHRGRGVDAGDAVSAFDEVTRDRFAAAAAEIEDRSGARDERGEPVEPRTFEQTASALAIEMVRMPLVQLDDPVCIVRHWLA
jgi:hypothetical protein